MLGTTTAFYDVDAILIAVGCTAAVTLGLTLFAFQIKLSTCRYSSPCQELNDIYRPDPPSYEDSLNQHQVGMIKQS